MNKPTRLNILNYLARVNPNSGKKEIENSIRESLLYDYPDLPEAEIQAILDDVNSYERK